MTTLANPLSDTERSELAKNEAIITKGLKSFIEVGIALRTIKDKRLYRDCATTFDVYCQTKWGFRDKRAYQLISGATIAENVSEDGIAGPENERQARQLATLSDVEQKIVWLVVQQTAPAGNVTSEHVVDVINVFKKMVTTGAYDPGSGVELTVNEIAAAAITEESYERLMRQKQALIDSMRKKELRRRMEKKMELSDLLQIKVHIEDSDALNRVSIDNIRFYIVESNWRADGRNAYFEFFEHRGPGHTRIHIPLYRKDDFAIYVGQCIMAIATAENRSELGVYYDLMALVIPESIVEQEQSITA